MPIYHYRARNKNQELVEGEIEGISESVVADELISRDLFIIALSLAKQGFNFEQLFDQYFNKVTKKDLAIFLRQLAILISAAIPLVQSLRILSQQVVQPGLKKALAAIVDEVEGGTKLSLALEKYRDIFSEYFISMIRSAETSGRLDETLNYLADEQEKDYELSNKVKGALMYPTFIVIMMFAAGLVMMLFVLPKLLEMFKEIPGGKLPFTTKILIAITNVTGTYWWLILLIVFGGLGFIIWWGRTPDGKLFFDKMKLKVPVFGTFFQYIYLVRFSRSFSTILIGGVTVPMGLKIVRDVVGNKVYEEIITETIKNVEDGNSISSAFAKHEKEIPSLVTQMIAVGEQTGRIDDVLGKISQFYTREINAIIENILSLIEPIIMLLLGLGVAVIVSGVLLPIYQISGNIQ